MSEHLLTGSSLASNHNPTMEVTREPPDLQDRQGRRISYLRLSVTDRCDFRCTYCMPQSMRFLPRNEVMTLEECLRIAKVFVDLGVRKLRVTGGEPLMRQNVMWLIRQLGVLPGLDELVLTSNGSQLHRFAPQLRAAGVRRINVSLDSLRAERFGSITRTGDLDQVLRGIAATRAAGFEHTKLNVVMMRGVNDDEFVDLLGFALEHELDISFIEEMPLGATGVARNTCSSESVRLQLAERYELLPSDETSGGPARYWRIPGSSTRVGFISPLSHNFCETCNRVRLTVKGELYPCLGSNDVVHLLPAIRGAAPDEALRQMILDGLRETNRGHDFGRQMVVPQVLRFMSMSGG